MSARTVADYVSPQALADYLRNEIATTEAESRRIANEGVDLYGAIDKLVRAFADKHRCDASGMLENIDQAVSYLVDDATGPSWRKKCRLENELSLQEDAA